MEFNSKKLHHTHRRRVWPSLTHSLTSTPTLPSLLAIDRAIRALSKDVCAPLTISISRMMCAGVKKCMPKRNPLLYSTVQWSTDSIVQFSSVQFSSVQFSSVQFSSVQFSSVQFSALQYTSAQCSQCSADFTVQSDSIVQRSAVQSVKFSANSSVQCSAVQCSQCSAVQCSQCSTHT